METILVWLLFILIMAAFAFYQSSVKWWLPGIEIVLAIYSYFQLFSLLTLTILGMIWFLLFVLVVIPPLRLYFITKPFLHWFRKQQPSLSDAEQEVLDSGGVWWEKEFFSGEPNWGKLFQQPAACITDEEQQFLNGPVATLCSLLNEWEISQNRDLSPEAWQYIKNQGFWGLVIPKEFGGHGFSAKAHSAIIAKIASRSYSAAVMVMVPNSLGPAEFLLHFGTDSQKAYYLPRLARGEEVACFALTAPNAGSDAMSMTDSGVVCKQIFEGKETLGIQLNWQKRYITLAPIATLIGLAFRLYDPDHLLQQQHDLGITLAVIPAHHLGIEIGKRHNPLNLGFMNGPIRGKDVFIPMDWVIGGADSCGKGWRMMMECLSIGRGISLPALSAGASQFCFRTSSAYAKIRQQFHRPIGDFEGIQELLARIAGFSCIIESARLFGAEAVDAGARPAVASAITKYHTTELLRSVILYSMDLHGGKAILLGPHNYLGLLHFSIPVNITVEGANILTRNLIIFGQGVIRCHPFLRDEITCAQQVNDLKTPKRFDKILFKHVGFFISRCVRAIVYGWTNGVGIRTRATKKTAYYLRHLTLLSNAFIVITDITLALLGGKLKFKESLSARLGDILSHLYLATAVLKYAKYQKANGENECVAVPQKNAAQPISWIFRKQTLAECKLFSEGTADEWVTEWSLDYCLFQIQQGFSHLFDNYPYQWLAKIMRILFLPRLYQYAYPQDEVSFKIAKKMQVDLAFRDQSTGSCYVSTSESDVIANIERTLEVILSHSELLKKIDNIKGINNEALTLAEKIETAYTSNILSEEEYFQMLELDKRINAVIAVDEFSVDEHGSET